MNRTGISYLTYTWNPIAMRCSFRGCPCRSTCWHLRSANRLAANPTIHPTHRAAYRGETGSILIPERLEAPLHVKKPARIGVQFMGDWMDDQVKPAWIDQILEVIAACPQHQFFTLTKQPQNLEPKIYGFDEEVPARELGGGDYLPNLWHGVSITDQEDADRMIPGLLRIPGKKWISIEPMLGPIYLPGAIGEFVNVRPDRLTGTKGDFVYKGEIMDNLDWVVISCESGPKRRPCPQDWMIDGARQCKSAGVKCYVKQINLNGKVVHDINLFPPELRVREF